MSEKPTVGRITQLSDKPCVRPAKLAPAASRPAPIVDPHVAVIDKLRALCGEAALNIESLSHLVQDDDLRTVMHTATYKLRAAAEGRKA